MCDYLNSLGLSFLVCKLGIITPSMYGVMKFAYSAQCLVCSNLLMVASSSSSSSCGSSIVIPGPLSFYLLLDIAALISQSYETFMGLSFVWMTFNPAFGLISKLQGAL